jgi:hypothetical protein
MMMHQLKFALLILAAVCTCTACADRHDRPDSPDDLAMMEVSLPIYTVASVVGIEPIYYYFDNGSEQRLDVYFIDSSSGAQHRVAKLLIYNGLGNLIGPTNEPTGGEFPLAWAQHQSVSTCRVISEARRMGRIEGDDYQSCFFWSDEELYGYKLYTVWLRRRSGRVCKSAYARRL